MKDGEQEISQKGTIVGIMVLIAILVVAIVTVMSFQDTEPLPPFRQISGEILVRFMPETNQSEAWDIVNETGGEIKMWYEENVWIDNTQYELVVAHLIVGEGNETTFISSYASLPGVYDALRIEAGVTG